MKKLLLFAAVFSFGFASAQVTFDMELGLISPATTVTGGVQFTLEVELTNNGPDAIPMGDTIYWAPLFGGSPLVDQNQQPIVYGNILQSSLGATQSTNFTRNLSVNGGQSGQIDVCGVIVAHFGVAAGGEMDSTNWIDCNSITYTSTVSTVDYAFQSIEDKSYYANGILFVNVINVLDSDRITYDVINLAGQTVSNGIVRVEGSIAQQDVQMPQLPSGVYVVRFSDGHGFNSTKKIMIQN